MTALDVLAAALYEQATAGQRTPAAWDTIGESYQALYRDQAEVVAARMAEAQPDPPEHGILLPDDPAERLAAAVELFVQCAEVVNTEGLHGVPDTDWQDGVRLLARIRYAMDQAGYVQSSLTTHVYLTGEHGDQDVEGVGRVKIARGRDRTKWDERGVVQAVLDAKMQERGGEMPNDPWDVAEWLLEVLGVGYCRVTPLRALGLDPKLFCEDTPGKVGVQLPSR